jgi:hypothetical protein
MRFERTQITTLAELKPRTRYGSQHADDDDMIQRYVTQGRKCVAAMYMGSGSMKVQNVKDILTGPSSSRKLRPCSRTTADNPNSNTCHFAKLYNLICAQSSSPLFQLPFSFVYGSSQKLKSNIVQNDNHIIILHCKLIS